MVYIFGHKKPDTDSICASISFSYLKNKLGFNTLPMTLGNINNETKFVLNYFNIEAPKYLNDVKLQIKDISYKKDVSLMKKVNSWWILLYAWKPHKWSSNCWWWKKLVGLVTLKELAKDFIEGDFHKLNTSYENILKTLNGEEVLKFDEEITGNILIASFRSTTFTNC